MNLLVAIPCLNEQKNVANVVRCIYDASTTWDMIKHVDVLVVDDGSTDNTAREAIGAGAIVVSHIKNKGLGRAFRTAVNYAVSHGYDLMVNMDGDGQFSASEIPLLLAPILNGETEVVSASRFLPDSVVEGMPSIKHWGNKIMAQIISHLCKHRYYDVSCGFRAYSAEALCHINLHGHFTYTQESFIAFAFYGIDVQEVPVTVHYFTDRKSRIAGNLWKYGTRTLFLIFDVYRDYYPLRFFGSIAIWLMVICLLFSGILFGKFFLTGTFARFYFAAFFAATFGILSVISMVLGILLQTTVRLQRNQERILYLLKRSSFKESKCCEDAGLMKSPKEL